MTTPSLFDYGATKKVEYFSGARDDYVAALPDDPDAVILEIGCGDGSTGLAAKQAGKAGRYIGIEIAEAPAEIARTRLDAVHVGNVETMGLDDLPERYDAVIASEVLEHLADPWATVARLAARLKPGGLFLASSPNVAHHKIVRSLLAGHWRLTEFGPMDRTHLRWFTPEAYAAMFTEAGFEIVYQGGVAPLGPKGAVLSRISGGRLDHLLHRQVNIHARKRG